jgi:uncharacterized membrane protein YccC
MMKRHRIKKHIINTHRVVQTVTSLNEGPWRWEVGVRAGLAMGLPVAIFTFAGNQSLGLMASLGGFTALYCAARNPMERLRILPLIAAGLVVASTLGVLCSSNEWLTIACLITVSALACVLTIGIRLGPPGPIMFVLVAAVSGHLAAPKSLGGAAIPGLIIPALVAVGGLLAYFVVVAPLILPHVRRNTIPLNGFTRLFPRIQFDNITTSISLRVVSGVTIAALAGQLFRAYRSYWVIIAVVAILQGSHDRRLSSIRAVQRVLGTILGVLSFELIVMANPSPVWFILIIMLLQFATEVVVTRNYVLALIFITPLALSNSTIGHLAESNVTVEGRIFDTLLGAIIAMVVFWSGEAIRILRTRRSKSN